MRIWVAVGSGQGRGLTTQPQPCLLTASCQARLVDRDSSKCPKLSPKAECQGLPLAHHPRPCGKAAHLFSESDARPLVTSSFFLS